MKTMAIIGLLGVGIICAPRPTMCVTMTIVTATAYCYPSAYCPGSSKGITASGERVREGFLAVSRDVEQALNLGFGDRLLLTGLGVYEFKDRMANRMHKKVDIYMACKEQAMHFGVRRYVILVKLA
ncbi:MAG: 3D domain-containing protein [Desulfobaccales bacterium]